VIVRRARSGRAVARLREAAGSPEDVERILQEQPVPIVEGTLSTFVWRGEADAVAVEHRIVGLQEPLPLRRIRNSDVWFATVELPPGSRVEYRMLLRYGDHIENVLDPRNPRQVSDPSTTKSVLEAGGYATPDWALPDPDVVPGELIETRVASKHLGRDVRLTLYLPMRMRRHDRLPVVVMHDGSDFIRYGGVTTVLDNLMHRRLMADAVVALLHAGDRFVEYTGNPAHARFLTAELIPQLERSLPLRGDPHGRILAGASLGAIAALSAAARAPGFYGGLLLQSGTFIYSSVGRGSGAPPPWWPPAGAPALERVLRFVNKLRADPAFLCDRIFHSLGAFEPSADRNRAMAATLRAMAASYRMEEGLDGHNWISWRDCLHDGFAWLLPGDARSIYP